LWQPENDGCGDADGGHECVGASIATDVDAAPVLELSEHVLDLVALAVEGVSSAMGTLRIAFDGVQAAMPRYSKAVRKQSA
jgi:hypothetical protein